MCIQYEKGKLTEYEALSALYELMSTEDIEPEHYLDAIIRLDEKENGDI